MGFDDLERELADLRAEINAIESSDADPRTIRGMDRRVRDLADRLGSALQQNERLVEAIGETRAQIALLREEVEKLTQPPSGYGIFLGLNSDGTANVFQSGRKLRVNVAPSIEPKTIALGQEVILNEAMNVVEVAGFEISGELMVLREVFEDGARAVVVGRDEEIVVVLAEPLRELGLRSGDNLLVDMRSKWALEKIRKPEVDELVLEEIPNVTYDDVGGLVDQIESIQDAVELPYLHADLFIDYALRPPKGILLYGPPGCGKTLIAKAVANSLAKRVAEKTQNPDARSYFLNVKGPELLNKYVGETERQIRQIFQRAKERSSEGVPVIVFFDEMDSLFRTRGTGISSDMETTIVPQLLAEIDGVEALRNVIVIGASNREDLIDPAILRPGRLDVKIKIQRPDESAARAIFAIYVTTSLPYDADEVAAAGSVEAMVGNCIAKTVEEMYSVEEHNKFLEVTYISGDKELMYFKDFASGAMIESIVQRAKKTAIKRVLDTGSKGIRCEDLTSAIREEYREHEDLPNTTNPDDWARISGKKGERIVYVRTLLGEGREKRPVETISPGQYL